MGCNNNALDPNAPEYQKPHKPQHNSGCTCSCKQVPVLDTETPDKPASKLAKTIILQKLLRTDYF